ncbi:MAG: magnesium-protoporphyrin IX monomethyl ester (oxidative) cyclase, partial [Pseudomonadota bacterium]
MNVQTPPKPLNGKHSPVSVHGTNEAMTSEKATDVAMQDTLLTPRFYTTDFDEMDAIDVTSVRKDW